MKVELESFSLCHMGRQLRELNNNVYKLGQWTTTYFWLDPPLKNKYTRFKFILKALVAEKLTRIFHDLVYDKNFIIRCDGKFAGLISLIEVCQNITETNLGQFEVWAPRTKLALLVNGNLYDDIDIETQIASMAVDKVEEYAYSKSVGYLRVKTSYKNTIVNNFFAKKLYCGYPNGDLDGKFYEYDWKKQLTEKTVAKTSGGR